MKEIREYRPYIVELTLVKKLRLTVEARTPEQAEEAAEEWVLDGEEGQVLQGPYVEIDEVYPAPDAEGDATGFFS